MLNAYVWYTITNSRFKLWCVFEIIVAVVDRDGKRRLLLRVPFVQCSKPSLLVSAWSHLGTRITPLESLAPCSTWFRIYQDYSSVAQETWHESTL
jgi:hypothetical protein